MIFTNNNKIYYNYNLIPFLRINQPVTTPTPTYTTKISTINTLNLKTKVKPPDPNNNKKYTNPNNNSFLPLILSDNNNKI